MSKALLISGIILLVHGAYSVIEENHRMRLIKKEDGMSSVGLDIAIEVIVGALLCCIGAARVSGHFMNISATTSYAKRKYETVFYHPNFMTFNHRGNSSIDDST